MAGLNRTSGRKIDGWEHCWQSIMDILTTPIGTRVQRRDYGSLIPRLMDRPMGQDMLVEFSLAIADALERWEPRFRLSDVDVQKAGSDGSLEIIVNGRYYPYGHKGDYSVVEDKTGRFLVARVVS